VFQQTAGARTVSPEVIGELAGVGGRLLGIPIPPEASRYVAHQLSGFPPIWTTLQLTLFTDGRFSASVVSHSLFPSMSFYMPAIDRDTVSRVTTMYSLQGKAFDAVPNLERWKADGWGSLSPGASGPSSGNPWGFNKNDLTVAPSDSSVRVV
jgi:hypothetical protein